MKKNTIHTRLNTMYLSKKFILFSILILTLSLNAFSSIMGYSGSSHSLETYKNRVNEIISDDTLGKTHMSFLW